MPYSAAQHRATMKYNKANYYSVSASFPLAWKESIQAAAAAAGLSVNAWLRTAVEEKLAKQSKEES